MIVRNQQDNGRWLGSDEPEHSTVEQTSETDPKEVLYQETTRHAHVASGAVQSNPLLAHQAPDAKCPQALPTCARKRV